MSSNTEKVKVGITIGDINGIGGEVILKTFSDSRIFNFCTPIIYGSTAVIAYNKKNLQLDKLNYQALKNNKIEHLGEKVLNVVNCWDEEVIINLGQPSTKAGECALLAFDHAINDALNHSIDAIVTAPVNKSLINTADKPFTGHTAYLTEKTSSGESLMLMVSDDIRVGLVTEHIALKDVASQVTAKNIQTKAEILNKSLIKDFGIIKPKIAVLGLNPHAGDDGVNGDEENAVISPTIEKLKESGMTIFGPYPADGLIGSGGYKKFDALLSMYHDQGLVAFKSISFGSGVNYTAGLPIIRTSPDHGTAFDIAGKNMANPDSFREALFTAIDICNHRSDHNFYNANPLKRKRSI